MSRSGADDTSETWTEKFCRIENGTLKGRSLDDTRREHTFSGIPLKDITDVTFNRAACECVFFVNDTKVRLRARTEVEAISWFRALSGCNGGAMVGLRNDWRMPTNDKHILGSDH